jgi:hypothetical protein
MKHTPGPWFVGKSNGNLRTVICTDPERSSTTALAFTVSREGRSFEQCEADASVMAASAEMYELLKAAQSLLLRSKHIIERSSSVPSLIEGDLETLYWKIDDLFVDRKLSDYKPIASEGETP